MLHVKRPGGAQGVGADEGGGANAGEEVGLAGFEGDEAAEDVEDVQEFGGVLGEPAVGLDFLQGRRRAPFADDGPGAVLLAVAEPVHQHLLARHLVLPDLGRHVVDEALADQQAALVGVIVDAVGHARRIGGDGAVPGDQRPVARGQARRTGGAAIGRVGVAFAEGVQPDDLLAHGDGCREQPGVAGEGQAQAGLHQIVLKAAGAAGMRHDGSQVGHDLLTADRRAKLLRQAIEEGALDVGRGGLVVGPEREDAPAE